MILREPPVVPDAETARRWAEDELAKSEYTEGGGNWLMDAIEAILRFFTDIADGASGRLGVLGNALVILAGVAVAAGIAWILVGPLRRSRRAVRAGGDLFDDERPASALADDARKAASGGDWATATAELYRALIRVLAERDIIVLTPGVTAHEAAVSTGAAVPVLAARVLVDADAFDRIRYGDGWADQQAYAHAQDTYRAATSAKRTLAASGAASGERA